MDAGLYNLSGDQASLDTDGELVVFNNTLRACSGVALSAGAFTLDPSTWLVLGNFYYFRTAGSVGWCWTNWSKNPSGGAPEIHGWSLVGLSPFMDATNGLCGITGPQTALVKNTAALTMGPVIYPGNSTTCTAESDYSSVCIVRMTGDLVSSGIYTLSANQLLIDTAGEQLVFNSTLRACAGVTLASGAFTFTQDGIYVVQGGFNPTRTVGVGTVLSLRWTTDPTTTGTTPFGVQVGGQAVAGDGTTPGGSNGGAIAIVNRSGSDVTIGMNVQNVPAVTAFTANAAMTGAMIWRLT